jgi:hypothetical protein
MSAGRGMALGNETLSASCVESNGLGLGLGPGLGQSARRMAIRCYYRSSDVAAELQTLVTTPVRAYFAVSLEPSTSNGDEPPAPVAESDRDGLRTIRLS